MFFERDILGKLIKWKSSSRPKPLLLRGARQVGKISVLQRFGANEYAETAYFNFDRQPDFKQFFDFGFQK